MKPRKPRFDLTTLARAEFRSTDRLAATGLLEAPPVGADLLGLFKDAPRKPLLVSEMAMLLGRSAESCVDPVIALVKAGSLDLLQRSDAGNHLVAPTAMGRAQIEVM